MTNKYLGENLIFIISLPRSGSTLLQRVLGGHPDVVTSSEPWIMLHPVYGRRDSGIETEYAADWAALGVNEFLENYTDGPEVYDDAIRAFAKTIYDNAIQKGGGSCFVDKTPRYVLIVDDLIRLFPQAKFVFLLRNPLSILSSIVNTQITEDLWGLENFSEELLRGPAGMLRGIECLQEKAIVVRYEEFVAEPETVLDALCGDLGISYQPDMLDYGSSPALKGKMQDRTGIGQHSRPEKSRSDSWRQILQNSQQAHFAQSYLAALGQQTTEKLGYSYAELQDAVDSAMRQLPKGEPVFPWRVAIKHPGQLLGRDQLAINKYHNRRDFGPVKAVMMTAGDFAKGIWANIRFMFGGG